MKTADFCYALSYYTISYKMLVSGMETETEMW